METCWICCWLETCWISLVANLLYIWKCWKLVYISCWKLIVEIILKCIYIYMCVCVKFCQNWMNLRKNRKTGAIQDLCRPLADGKELCHQPADGKAATWQLPVQPGALAGLFGYFVVCWQMAKSVEPLSPASWRHSLTRGSTWGLAYFATMPSTGRRQMCNFLCRQPADG